MKLIFDADSLIYASCFKRKEDRTDSEDLFETDDDEYESDYISKNCIKCEVTSLW